VPGGIRLRKEGDQSHTPNGQKKTANPGWGGKGGGSGCGNIEIIAGEKISRGKMTEGVKKKGGIP